MVLGVVSSEGDVMPPHIFERGSRLNAEGYIHVLSTVVKPWIETIANGRPYVFQQDGAPPPTPPRLLKSGWTRTWDRTGGRTCGPPPPPTWIPSIISCGAHLSEWLMQAHTPISTAWSKPFVRGSANCRRNTWSMLSPGSGPGLNAASKLEAVFLNNCPRNIGINIFGNFHNDILLITGFFRFEIYSIFSG